MGGERTKGGTYRKERQVEEQKHVNPYLWCYIWDRSLNNVFSLQPLLEVSPREFTRTGTMFLEHK